MLQMSVNYGVVNPISWDVTHIYRLIAGAALSSMGQSPVSMAISRS
jgi:hypothetical protein